MYCVKCGGGSNYYIAPKRDSVHACTEILMVEKCIVLFCLTIIYTIYIYICSTIKLTITLTMALYFSSVLTRMQNTGLIPLL